MRSVFIAGTDTGAGKTVVAGCLAYYLRKTGARVITQKWVQTGAGRGKAADIKAHMKMMAGGMPRARFARFARDFLKYSSSISPYIFAFPASPHLASRMERRAISKARVKKAFHDLHKDFDCVIVEGAGGVLVPFNEKEFLADIAAELRLPAILVIDNRLGAIHQALSSLEALRSRNVKVLGVVFNNRKGCDKRILDDNARIIKKLGKTRVFGALLRHKSGKQALRSFAPIAKNIVKVLQ